MINAIRHHLARRAARQAQRDYDLYQSQPAGAGWNINVATALMLKAEKLISKVP